MFIQGRRKLVVVSALAAMLASVGSAAIARAADYEGDDDDSPYKTAACTLIGCPNGSRTCGTATGTIKAGIPPFVGEVSVSYTCYENPSF